MGDYHNRIMNLQVGEDMPEENPGRGVYKSGHRDARHAAAEIAAEADAEIRALKEALANVMGHLDTPIALRRLGLSPSEQWLREARDTLEKYQGEQDAAV